MAGPAQAARGEIETVGWEPVMFTRKTLLIAGLISCAATQSTAQACAASKPAATPAPVTAPAETASAPAKHRHDPPTKKAQPVSPAASSAK